MTPGMWLLSVIVGGMAVLWGYSNLKPHPRLPEGINRLLAHIQDRRRKRKRQKLIDRWNYWADRRESRNELMANLHMTSGNRLAQIFEAPELGRAEKWRIYYWAFEYVATNVVPQWQHTALTIMEKGAGKFPTPREGLEGIHRKTELYGNLLRHNSVEGPWLEACPFPGDVPEEYTNTIDERMRSLLGCARALAYLNERPEEAESIEPLAWYPPTYQYPEVVELLLDTHRWRALEGVMRLGSQKRAREALHQMAQLQTSFLPELIAQQPERLDELLDSQTGARILASAEDDVRTQLIRQLGTAANPKSQPAPTC